MPAATATLAGQAGYTVGHPGGLNHPHAHGKRDKDGTVKQMSAGKIKRLQLAGGLLAAAFVLMLPAQGLAGEAKPHAVTGGVAHVTSTSVELLGTVRPEGIATSYYFKYGPTLAYGQQTKPVAVPVPVPPASSIVKVGQTVTGLLAGYHYRIFVTYVAGGIEKTVEGADKQFKGGKLDRQRITLPKGKEEQLSAVYGGSAVLEGSLAGLNNAGQQLVIQSSPYPYTAAFATLGTTTTSRSGSFLFKIAKITKTAELRVLTSGLRPVYSSTVVVHVTPRITLHVRTANGTGLYRFFGTVGPARTGAVVQIQQLLPRKATSSGSGPQAHPVGSTILKRGTAALSRFSVVLKLTGTYRYRVFVKLPKGSVESGHGSDLLIRAPAASVRRKHRK